MKRKPIALLVGAPLLSIICVLALAIPAGAARATNAVVKKVCATQIHTAKVARNKAVKAAKQAKSEAKEVKEAKGTPDASDTDKSQAVKAAKKAVQTTRAYHKARSDKKKCTDKVKAERAAAKAQAKKQTSDDVANQINQVFQGFQPGELAIGSNNVSFNGAPEERGTAAFSQRTLKTQADVAGFLNEDTDVSKAAKQNVVDSIRKAGFGDDEVKRALDGSGYFPIQVKTAANVLGTTYYQDGKVLEAGAWRAVGTNDVFWLFMTKDKKIVFGATVRADCGNPHLTQVVPVRPSTPPATPVEHPPTPSSNCPVPPIGVPPQFWDTVHCKKTGSDFGYQQDTGPQAQPLQSNPCCNTGPTAGATTPPASNPQGPAPMEGTPVANPTPAPGYSSPVLPGGSTGTPDGEVIGGGPTTPSTTIPVDTDHHTTDPGGF
jgi:hypothetical protein